MGLVLHEDMKELESFHMEELARIGQHFEAELTSTDQGVQSLIDKTEELDNKLAMHVDKVLAIEVHFFTYFDQCLTQNHMIYNFS